MHVCSKNKCPNRISIGSESDKDSQVIVCLKCSKTIYTSESRAKGFLLLLKNLIIAVLLLSIAVLLLCNYKKLPNFLPQKETSTTGYSPINEPRVDEISITEEPLEKTETIEKINYDEKDLSSRNGKENYQSTEAVEEPDVEPISVSNNENIGKNVSFDLNIPDEGLTVGEFFYPVNKSIGLGDDYQWNFDPEVFEGNTPTRYKYDKPGNYEIVLKSDEGITFSEKILVKEKENKIKFYKDQDGDGLGDQNDFSKFIEGKAPNGIWVNNSDDKCPGRSGPPSNKGCPIIKLIHDDIYKGEPCVISLEYDSKSGDKYEWSSNSEINFSTKKSKNCSITTERYGWVSISTTVENKEDGFTESKTWKKLSKISTRDLQNKLKNDIIVVGQYDPGTSIPRKVRNKSESIRNLITALCDPKIKITENGKAFGNNAGAFIDAKMLTKGSYVTDVRVNKIVYNDKGLISELDLKLIKF